MNIQLLRQISKLKPQEKEAVMKLIKSDVSEKVIELLLTNSDTLNGLKEKMGLSKVIITSFNNFFENIEFFSENDFFLQFKNFFENIYNGAQVSFVKDTNNYNESDFKKTLKLNENIFVSNGNIAGIYIETHLGNYFIEITNISTEIDLLKIKELFETKSVHERIKLVFKNFKSEFKDELTDCYTRSYLNLLEKRGGYSVLYLDLNYFKSLNDTYGHAFGDKVLQEFSNLLISSVRENDKVIRIGGDEFVICVETSSKDVLIDVKGRILLGLKSLILSPNETDKSINLSTSIGIKEYIEGLSLFDIIDLADKKMYDDKNNNKGIDPYPFLNQNGIINIKYAHN